MIDTATPSDARIFAPAAARNRDAIRDVVVGEAPKTDCALEIASGSGEHVVHIALATPALTWQPTDPDPVRRASVDAWRLETGVDGVAPARALDAARPGWSAEFSGQDLVLLVNLLHLITEAEARTVLREIAAALAPGGVALIYGPFLRDGCTTSPGDARFDAALRTESPGAGYKDIAWVSRVLTEAGLAMPRTIDMPANNLMIVARKPQEIPDGP